MFRQPFLLRLSADWIGYTHIVKNDLLYLKSIDINVNHIFKMSLHADRHLKKIECHGPAKLTCKSEPSHVLCQRISSEHSLLIVIP